MTVLFIDMVGSTDISVRLDDEDFKDVIYRYRDICTAAIRRFDSTLVRYIGDGILVCFGFPVAHEDDPVRAVRAAIAMRDDFLRLEQEEASDSQPIRVRMGIHSGIVIAGDLKSSVSVETMGILGEAPNIASRLQQLAPPGGLIISDATAQLIGDRFNLKDLGAQDVRGAASAMTLYEVVGERAGPAWERRRFLKKIVGREQELTLLRDRFQSAATGEGQLVLIVAEAGGGKTHLVRDFRNSLDASAFLPITCYCSAHNRTSAYYPIVEMIRRVITRRAPADSDKQVLMIERAFAGLESVAPAAVALIAELLTLPAPSPIGDIPPAQRREQLFDALTQWLLKKAEQTPILLVVEDLHWADASTIDLLERVVQQLSSQRIMAVFTFRPEFTAKWLLQAQSTRLGLRCLSKTETRTLIEQIAGAGALSSDIIGHIIAKTSGIPLFIEELTKAVIDTQMTDGDDDQSARASESIPSTLRGSLAASLDRLEIARPLAQVAATLGRTFDGEILAAVTGESQHVLQMQLAELIQEGFIQRHGAYGHAEYSFRHALIQDAAYDSLLRSERREMHRKIADILATRFPEVASATPEILAAHYSSANLPDAAVIHWEAAGKKAAERSANIEAVSHFESALAMLRSLPNTVDHARQELALEVERGSQLLATKGNAAPQVEEVFNRAQQLSEQLDEHGLLFRALYGLMMFCIVRGQLDRAQELGTRLIDIAQRADDSDLLLQAKRPVGLTLFYMGRFQLAKEHLDAALKLYDPDRHHHHRFEYGSDPAVLAQCNLAWTQWFLGLADSAIQNSARAIERAHQLDHPHSLGFALSFEASIRQARGEPAETRDAAEQVIAVGEIYRFPYWSAWGHILRGWALGKIDRPSAGIAEIEQGLADYRATGAELIRPYGLMLLAETLASQGDVNRALTLLDGAQSSAESSKITFCVPEMHRLRGLFLSKLGSQAALEHVAQAADLALELGTSALELRALNSLLSIDPRGYAVSISQG